MRRSFTTLATALLLPFTACGDEDGPTGPNVEASGTYQLSTVNGEALPFTLAQDGADMIEVIDGQIELHANGTFTDSTTFRLTDAGSATTEAEVYTGSYSQTGNALRFTPSSGGVYSMSVTEDALTQTAGEFVLVYRR
jgi:hypothetical protein